MTTFFFFVNFGGYQFFFVGPLIPLFGLMVTSVLSFKASVGSSHLHSLLPACNGILRFTSGVTPADLLVARMATELFLTF